MPTAEQAREQTNRRMLYARFAELRAIEEVVKGYVHILSVTRLPEEYANLFTLLYAFRQRYWPLLEREPQGEELLPIEVTVSELIAFGGAILHYGRFWCGMSKPGRRRGAPFRSMSAMGRPAGSNWLWKGMDGDERGASVDPAGHRATRKRSATDADLDEYREEYLCAGTQQGDQAAS